MRVSNIERRPPGVGGTLLGPSVSAMFVFIQLQYGPWVARSVPRVACLFLALPQGKGTSADRFLG
jgi:hypothetical protein